MAKVRPWAAALAVAATYAYFLIFAEFALIELARGGGLDGAALRTLMGVLALGGLTGSGVAAWRYRAETVGRALAMGLAVCAVAAALAAGWGGPMLWLAALLTGAGLGWLTVTLAAGLRGLIGEKRLGLWIGVGTGLGYAACNLPWVFQATPAGQAWFAATAAAAGAVLVWRWRGAAVTPVRGSDFSRRGVAVWVGLLLVLVWLDSSAFYVIQHVATLREPTWGAGGSLWLNAAVHLLAAVAAGWAIDRGWMPRVLPVAFALLWLACWRLGHGLFAGTVVLYATAVSLYSTVLVAYPARSGRPAVATAVYALAGWLGSALGIGMVQDLHRIPAWFLTASAAVFLLGWLWQNRTAGWLGVIAVLVALAPTNGFATEADEIVLGREVYIAEGCIHCHSQYIRPGTADETRWGPAAPLPEALAGDPPLLGNRRQGPDLANVGLRRSPEWNRLHLIEPTRLAPGSRMPAYAHLFRAGDARGTALMAYLATLGADRVEAAAVTQAAWRPQPAELRPATEQGRLFARLCAACHGPTGRGDGPLAAQLASPPPDFTAGWRRLDPADPEFGEKLARLIKFGLPGTAMAGHETLADRDVLSLAAYVQTLHSGSRP